MLESIALIILFGLVFGKLTEFIKLPSLIGMIIAGIVLGPHGFNLLDPVILKISPDIRKIALVIILTRAGLSLDIFDFLKVGRPILLLSCVPALFEIIGYSLLVHLFFGLSYIEGAIIGCVIAAVSPAVVVPRMINLINETYGLQHRVPQMLLSGSSMDDVFDIVYFTSLVGLMSSSKINVMSFVQIPISIILGALLGALMAFALIYIFKHVKIRDTVKVLVLLSFSLLALQLEEFLKDYISISSLIGVMIMGVVFKNFSRKTALHISMKYNKLWAAAEVFLFVLVGVTINIEHVIDSGILVVIVVLLALIFRSAGVFTSLIGTRLNVKEKSYCAIAYIPKATVQAVMGGVPLAMGLSIGEITLTFAALSILVTAPLGAYLMDLSYKKLLKKYDVWEILLKNNN